MIRLENINVKYDKVIFKDAKIKIPNGKVTAIVGESGVGKTTLLYMLGLISSEKIGDYYWDEEKVDLYKDKECSEIRKKRIGYIFQDNNLIEKLTIKGNIELSAKIAGINISKEDIVTLLKYVNLDYNIDEYPSKLSGGEKQRLAIACALSKKPDLVIADEPTSALDINNTKLVISILRKYAHQENKKVVIVTHNSYVSNKADIQYKIENNKIVLVNGDNQNEIKNQKEVDNKGKINVFFLGYYAINSVRKEVLKKSFILLLLSVSIAFTVLSINFGEQYKKNLNRNINEIANNNILAINKSVPLSDKKNVDDYMSIAPQYLETMSQIQGVEEVYPLIEFRSFGAGKEEYIISSSIVKKDESKYEFIQENNSQYAQYTILPYIDNNYMKKRTKEYCNSKNGVYISSSLANKLEIKNIENEILNVEICVPKSIIKGSVTYDEIGYEADYDEVEKKKIQVRIKGILDDNFSNTYSIYGDDVIYMDYDKMKSIIDETFNEYSGGRYKSSAVIIKIKDFSLLDDISKKISNINPNFVCVSELQDIESMQAAIDSTKTAVLILSSTLFGIVFILMSVIYVQQTERRKYEFAMLKANGLTKKEVVQLVCIESFLDVIKMIIMSLIIMFTLVMICRLILAFTLITIDVKNIFLLTGISVVAIYIPTVITLKYVNKFEPAKIMRS